MSDSSSSEVIAKQSGAMDIVFVIDTTDSMETLIQAFEQICFTIDEKCRTLSERIKFNYGVVLFKDPIGTNGRDQHSFVPISNDINVVINALHQVKAEGGGDIPEDWAGAFNIVNSLSTMNYTKDSIKIVIFATDAPSHGHSFGEAYESFEGIVNDTHHEREPICIQEIEKMIDNNINFCGFCLLRKNSILDPMISFQKLSNIYNSYKEKEEPKAKFWDIKMNNSFEELKNTLIERIFETVHSLIPHDI